MKSKIILLQKALYQDFMDNSKANIAVYRASTRNSLRLLLLPVIYAFVVYLINLPLLVLTANSPNRFAVIVATTLLILAQIIPPLLILINYNLLNRKVSIRIEKNSCQLCFIKNSRKYIFDIDDTSKIEKFSTYSQDSVLTSQFPWKRFYFYRIEFKCGSVIVLTSLLNCKLEKALPDFLIKERYRVIPISFQKNMIYLKDSSNV